MHLDPQRTALVAVHLQGDVVTHEGASGGFFADMVDKTGVLDRAGELIAAARAAGATIAYTRIVFSAGHPELIANNALFGVVEPAKCCLDGTPGTTIVAEVAPRDGDLVIDHHRVNDAHGSALVSELRERGVDTVLVFGVATNISVEGTVRALSDEGLRTNVVAGCCTAADQTAHHASVATMGLVVSEVTDAATAIAALGSEVPA